MHDFHVLVAGPERSAAVVVKALRARGLRAWSDRLDRVAEDPTSLMWADVIVLFDSPELAASRHQACRGKAPRLLLSSNALAVSDRADLIERYGYEFVLAWPTQPDLVAAFVERAAHRRAVPLRFSMQA